MFWGKEKGQLPSRAPAGCKSPSCYKTDYLLLQLKTKAWPAKAFTQDYRLEAEKSN